MAEKRIPKAKDSQSITPKDWRDLLKKMFREWEKKGDVGKAERLHAERIIDTHDCEVALASRIERRGEYDLHDFALAILSCANWMTFRPRKFDPRECLRLAKALRTAKVDLGFMLLDPEALERMASVYEGIGENRREGRPENAAGDSLRRALAERFLDALSVDYEAVAALYRATFPGSEATKRSVANQLSRKNRPTEQ